MKFIHAEKAKEQTKFAKTTLTDVITKISNTIDHRSKMGQNFVSIELENEEAQHYIEIIEIIRWNGYKVEFNRAAGELLRIDIFWE